MRHTKEEREYVPEREFVSWRKICYWQREQQMKSESETQKICLREKNASMTDTGNEEWESARHRKCV